MQDIYLIKVDQVCKYCGARNEISTAVEVPVDAIACGRCGEPIMLPDEMSPEEKIKLDALIYQAIKGEE
jgi:ribosomal protein L40E